MSYSVEELVDWLTWPLTAAVALLSQYVKSSPYNLGQTAANGTHGPRIDRMMPMIRRTGLIGISVETHLNCTYNLLRGFSDFVKMIKDEKD